MEAEATLRRQIALCRFEWVRAYDRFWTLRHENSVRRPSWRVEMEQDAARRSRAMVRRYAMLRGLLREHRKEKALCP